MHPKADRIVIVRKQNIKVSRSTTVGRFKLQIINHIFLTSHFCKPLFSKITKNLWFQIFAFSWFEKSYRVWRRRKFLFAVAFYAAESKHFVAPVAGMVKKQNSASLDDFKGDSSIFLTKTCNTVAVLDANNAIREAAKSWIQNK